MGLIGIGCSPKFIFSSFIMADVTIICLNSMPCNKSKCKKKTAYGTNAASQQCSCTHTCSTCRSVEEHPPACNVTPSPALFPQTPAPPPPPPPGYVGCTSYHRTFKTDVSIVWVIQWPRGAADECRPVHLMQSLSSSVLSVLTWCQVTVLPALSQY